MQMPLVGRRSMPDRLKTHNFFWTWGGGQQIWAQNTASMRHERNWMVTHTRASVSQKCWRIYLNQHGNHLRQISIYSDRFSTTIRCVWRTILSSSRAQARTVLLVKTRGLWRSCCSVVVLKIKHQNLIESRIFRWGSVQTWTTTISNNNKQSNKSKTKVHVQT